MMLFDHLVEALRRVPKKLQRRALKLQQQLMTRKPPKRRKGDRGVVQSRRQDGQR